MVISKLYKMIRKKLVLTFPAIDYKRKFVRILHEVVHLLLTNVDVVEQKTGD